MRATWAGYLAIAPLLLFGAYMGYSAMVGSQSLMFPGRTHAGRPPDAPYRKVVFQGYDGTPLDGWYVPAARPTHTAVVVFHGRGSNKGYAYERYGALLHDRYNVFVYDSRYSGDSGGRFQTLGWCESRDAALALAEVRKAGNTALGLAGESLGGAVAVEAGAAAPDVRAVWEDCAFDTLHDAIAPRAANLGYPFADTVAYAVVFAVGWRAGADVATADPIRCVAGIAPRPLCVVHGQLDDQTPPINGERLFAAAREPKQIWRTARAHHAESVTAYPQAYRQRLRAFFAAALP